MKAYILRKHINEVSSWKLNKAWDFMIRIFTPAVLLYMVGSSLIGEFSEPYGNYPVAALLLLGLGWIAATIVLAVAVTIPKWEPNKLKYERRPEEDHLIV